MVRREPDGFPPPESNLGLALKLVGTELVSGKCIDLHDAGVL